MDNLVNLERYTLDAFAWIQQAEFLRYCIRVRIWTAISDELVPEEGALTDGVLAVTLFRLDNTEKPSRITRDIFRWLSVNAACHLFSWLLPGHHWKTFAAVNCSSKRPTWMGAKEWIQICSLSVESYTFYCIALPQSRAQTHHIVKIGDKRLPVVSERSSMGSGGTRDSLKKHVSMLRKMCRGSFNLIRVVAHMKWGGGRNTLHNNGLRLAFCISPVPSMNTETNKTSLEERQVKLSWHYNTKIGASIENPLHYTMHEFDQTTKVLYASSRTEEEAWLDSRLAIGPMGGAIMTPAEINADLICPLGTPSSPPGTHEYNPKENKLMYYHRRDPAQIE